MWGKLTAIIGAALLAQSAFAAEPQDETTVEGLVVTAKKAPDQQALTDFVASVASSTNGRLARWDRSICTSVVGLKEAYAQLLIDQIAAAAIEAGLDVGQKGCQPNMIIVATDDSDALVKMTVAANPDGFSKYDTEMTAGRKAFDAFLTSPEPVRWWHVSARVTADGQRYDVGGSVRVRDVGRLKSTTRMDFDRAVVVMDVKRIGKVRFAALADYVAMVGLAQIDPKAEIETGDTVLNLFKDREAGRTPAEGLTAWDKAYLSGLYAARRDVRRDERQKQDIVRSMAGTLASEPKAK
ncbi:hypothetical protein [Caulobacter mirabilis]|uniref:Uncharacterized protein n=1 Tax=Caulobacter mirabilis TaxID=69666 RepID=A0A2D2AYP0_9CAUL|nr:hypothetical protein [Caulobacter mirabilis]ATQ43113.1 hypothetical protein CSW64_12160 [Caulobacter mirabilis]